VETIAVSVLSDVKLLVIRAQEILNCPHVDLKKGNLHIPESISSPLKDFHFLPKMLKGRRDHP